MDGLHCRDGGATGTLQCVTAGWQKKGREVRHKWLDQEQRMRDELLRRRNIPAERLVGKERKQSKMAPEMGFEITKLLETT